MATEKSPKELEQEKREAFEKSIPKMSHKQLVAQLKREANVTYEGKGFCMPPNMDFAALGGKRQRNRARERNALATVLLTVLENTVTAPVFEFKENGDPKRFARKDQFSKGKMVHYLR